MHALHKIQGYRGSNTRRNIRGKAQVLASNQKQIVILKRLLFYVCVCVPICMYTMCMPGVFRIQKRPTGCLKLGLLVIVSDPVGAGD